MLNVLLCLGFLYYVFYKILKENIFTKKIFLVSANVLEQAYYTSQFLRLCPAWFARNPRQIPSEDLLFSVFSENSNVLGQKL